MDPSDHAHQNKKKKKKQRSSSQNHGIRFKNIITLGPDNSNETKKTNEQKLS